MKLTDAKIKKYVGLKTLDADASNNELNRMPFDELLVLMRYYIQQPLGKEVLLSEVEEKDQIETLLKMTREPEIESSPENKY